MLINKYQIVGDEYEINKIILTPGVIDFGRDIIEK